MPPGPKFKKRGVRGVQCAQRKKWAKAPEKVKKSAILGLGLG